MKQILQKHKLILVTAVLFGGLVSILSSLVAIILQKLIDIVMAGEFQTFWTLLLLTAGYLLLLGIISYCYTLSSKALIRTVTKDLRRQLFYGILRRNPKDFTACQTADYLSALTNDIKLLEENYITPFLTTIQYGVLFLSTLVILLFLSPMVTLVLLICMILMFLIPSLFGKALTGRQERYSNSLSRFTAKAKDLLSGYEVIRSFGIQKKIKKQYDEENEGVAQAKFSADRLFALNESISDMLSTASVVIVIFLSAYFVLAGKITMGTLLALVQLSGTFVTPILLIMQNLPKIKGIQPVVQKLEQFSCYEDRSFTGSRKPGFQDSISAENVSFSYDGITNQVHELHALVRKREKIALVGKSGCGKSTLIKLLTGTYYDYEGSICYDGQDLKQCDIRELTRLYAVIHQNVTMFHDSILQNILLYEDFTEEELQRALKESGADLFIRELPDGLHTVLTENGANLSGGQRQRIALARALIRKTPILILDEGTSAIDMQTAYEIEQRLLQMEDLTLITITHHMSEELLSRYHRILYMENGSLKEEGSFQQLIKKGGGFLDFYTLKTVS